MPAPGQREHLASHGGSDKREIVCHYGEVSWRSRERGRNRLALSRRNWHAHLATGSIRENSGFHGEKLAPPGPSITCQYPLSFFRFAVRRHSGRRTGLGAEDASEIV